MKITYKLLIDTSKDNLTKIFNNSFLANNLNKNAFAELILKQISILDFAEKKQGKGSSSKEWLEKLNVINNTNVKLIDVSNLNINEMYDEINYINVYIKNVFKYDLSKNESVETVQKVESKTVNDTPTKQSFQYGGSPFSTYGFNPENITTEGIKEQIVRDMALKRMIEEVRSGRFYQYKTKPISIIIFKYIIGIIALLFALLIIVKLVIAAVIGAVNLNINSNSGSRNLFGWILFTDIITILGSIWLTYSMFKNSKNENYKYYFIWPNAMLIIFVILFNLVSSLIEEVPYYQNQNWWINNNSKETIRLFFVYLYIVFTLSGIGFFLFLISIMTIFLNPKLDLERIQLKQEEIYREIKQSMSQNDKL